MAEFNAVDAWADPADRDEFMRILLKKGSVPNYETTIIQKGSSWKHIIFPGGVCCLVEVAPCGHP